MFRQAIIGGLLAAGLLAAQTADYQIAQKLYQRTDYRQALEVLEKVRTPDAATLQLIGQSRYGLGEYKEATEAFDKAVRMAPNKSELYTWLGRAYGRRAETSLPLTAPRYAAKARESFEKAVALDAGNRDALDDLFDYYLNAPGFLGGGVEKAEGLAKHMAGIDPAWGQRAEARIKEHRKEYSAAEQHLRRATELAPKQVGRMLDLAKYLAKQGRTNESDSMFVEASKIAPDNPEVLFARAKTYVEQKRNLKEARQLLERYLASSLTPDNTPRAEAEDLLKKIER
jgi:tetratricopeptide (TPR) repeat protein